MTIVTIDLSTSKVYSKERKVNKQPNLKVKHYISPERLKLSNVASSFREFEAMEFTDEELDAMADISAVFENERKKTKGKQIVTISAESHPEEYKIYMQEKKRKENKLRGGARRKPQDSKVRY